LERDSKEGDGLVVNFNEIRAGIVFAFVRQGNQGDLLGGVGKKGERKRQTRPRGDYRSTGKNQKKGVYLRKLRGKNLPQRGKEGFNRARILRK